MGLHTQVWQYSEMFALLIPYLLDWDHRKVTDLKLSWYKRWNIPKTWLGRTTQAAMIKQKSEIRILFLLSYYRMHHMLKSIRFTSPDSCELWLNWAKRMRTCSGAQHTMKTSIITQTILTTWQSRNLCSIIIFSYSNAFQLLLISKELGL